MSTSQRFLIVSWPCAVLGLLWSLTPSLSATQPPGRESALFVGFWNVENLFDTVNDPKVELDEEFTPKGNKNWTPERLQIKLGNLADVISRMNKGRGPDVLGLCEIENRQVAEMLAGKLSRLNREYKVVHKDSPSGRGIDCALIYDAKVLKLKGERFHGISGAGRTRDILEAEFDRGGDVLTVFVNHWPSRGGDNTEPGRIAAARTLRKRVDQLLSADKQADFVIVGDLNDEPANASIKTTLNAASSMGNLQPGALFDSMGPIKQDPRRGTIVFQNKWQVFDHVILSPGLLDQRGFRWLKDSTGPQIPVPKQLFDPPGDANIPRPNRSYTGNTFHRDGYADHLPVGCVLLQGP